MLRSRFDPNRHAYGHRDRDGWCDGDSYGERGRGDADGNRNAGSWRHIGAGAVDACGGRGLSDRGEYRRE